MSWFSYLLMSAGNYVDILTLLGVIGGMIGWVWRMLMQSKKSVDALLETIADIKKQLVTNGGSSLFDVVKATSARLESTSAKVDSLTDDMGKVKAWQWSFAQGQRMPMWESDKRGSCVRINIAMGNLVGRSADEMAGSGWENIMCPEDRERIWVSWKDAVERGRSFEDTYRVRHSKTGQRYQVKAVASPIFADGKVSGFLGRFEEVTEV